MSQGRAAMVAVRLLRPAIAAMRARGVDVDAVMREGGVNPALLGSAEARVPHAALVSVWARAEELTGDAILGVHVAELVDFRFLDFVERETEYLGFQLLAGSATVGEGLARFARYYPLGHLGARLLLSRGDGRLAARFRLSARLEAPRPWIEMQVAAMLKAIRSAACRAITPVELRLPHPEPAPAAAEECRGIFGCPTRWDAGEAALLLLEADLDVPMRCPKLHLIEQLEARAEAILGGLSDEDDLALRVRSLIASTVHSGPPSVDQTARMLGMSPRTLARRLEDEATSHQKLLDEVRANLAQGYLADRQNSVADVAALLGYSDVRPFQRAFRRWFGRSPAAFRAR
jgi:AraC-like DNA-binding protein